MNPPLEQTVKQLEQQLEEVKGKFDRSMATICAIKDVWEIFIAKQFGANGEMREYPDGKVSYNGVDITILRKAFFDGANYLDSKNGIIQEQHKELSTLRQQLKEKESENKQWIKWLYLFVKPWDGQSILEALNHEHGQKWKEAYDNQQNESALNTVKGAEL